MNPNETSLWDIIDDIRSADDRYRREAYLFVVAALGATVQDLPPERQNDPVRRHLSGQELLHGMVRLARQEFGSMAPVVFGEWGLEGGEDVGHIVFHLVQSGQLSARPEDSIDDFRIGLDFAKAFANDHAPFPVPRATRPPSGRKTGPELGA
jgi:uncharacterized repeat protein (TIGR04138 family)